VFTLSSERVIEMKNVFRILAIALVVLGMGTSGSANHIFGDYDFDNDVDINDFGIFVYDYDNYQAYEIYELRSDYQPDGAIDISDYGKFVENYGLYPSQSGGYSGTIGGPEVPEATSVLLLVSGMIVSSLLRYRN